MIGVFVPWIPGRKNSPGWITDANGCDIWQGARNPRGYPTVQWNARKHSVSRVRYEREIGAIPEGLHLDHFFCDNGPGGCCNPFHCRPVSRRENTLRSNAASAINAAKTHCPKGHLLAGENLVKCDLLLRGLRRCRICANAAQAARKRLQRQRKFVK